jgi:hypothetical protein
MVSWRSVFWLMWFDVLFSSASPEKVSEFANRPKTATILQAKQQQGANRYGGGRRGGRDSDEDEDEDNARAIEVARRADQRHKEMHRDRERDGRGDRDRDRQERRGGGRRNWGDDDEEEDRDYPEDRRGYDRAAQPARGQRDEYPSSSSHSNRRGGYDEDERDARGRNRDRDSQRDSQRDRESGRGQQWAGASGGRDVQQQQQQVSSQRQSQDRGGSQSAHLQPQQASLVQAQPSAGLSLPGPLVIVPPDLSDMRAFLTTPLPKNVGTLQCYIRRNKSGTNKLFPIYSLYLKVRTVLTSTGCTCNCRAG